MKKQLLIGTTAINRPVLHRDNIPEWYNWINQIDRTKYDIHWFINIDYIVKLGLSYEETLNNFKDIIKDIPIIFLKNDKNTGNFLDACKRVSSHIEDYVNKNNIEEKDTFIFWLEDDWKLQSNLTIPLQHIIETYILYKTCVNLTFIKPNYIHALAPSIINYALWKQLHLTAWKQQLTHIDPEHCAGLYFLKNFESKYIYVHNLTVITKYKLPNIKNSFFNHEFLNYNNSFYTYHTSGSIKKDNYIHKIDIRKQFKDTILFVRFTCGFCPEGVMYGRNFMKKYDLNKNRVQNNNNIDFYK